MPIFESREQRTKRLFAVVTIPLMVKAHDRYGQMLQDIPVDAWISAGSIMAQTLVTQVVKRERPLGKAWGRGDDAKALRLLRLFALAMVSRYYSFLDSADANRTEDDKVAVRRSAAESIAEICGEDPAYTVPDFLNVDRQFRCDEHQRKAYQSGSGLSLYEKSLLFDLALEICGYATGLNLRTTKFPLESYASVLTAERRYGASPEDVLILAALEVVAYNGMVGFMQDTRPVS
jgi:hypothetical protein